MPVCRQQVPVLALHAQRLAACHALLVTLHAATPEG
jgi:hypothetical protein